MEKFLTVELDEEGTFLEITVEITYLGHPPSWDDWDGGHPGETTEFEIQTIRLYNLNSDGEEIPKEKALVFLGYSEEEFEGRLQKEVEAKLNELDDEDYLKTHGGFIL